MAEAPVALVTGAAQRIGAAIARTLHAAGYRVLLHYRHSHAAAQALAQALGQQRPGSVQLLAADLDCHDAVLQLAHTAAAHWQRLDLLVNNASAFHPTPVGETTESDWERLFASNLKAPFFLAQALAPALRAQGGAIINLADIHAAKPLRQHSVYCAAKAGLVMLTQSLALELAPQVRVNAIAPGAILWPDGSAPDPATEARWLAGVPLGRRGDPQDIADTVLFLARTGYITGQVIAVDGGKSLGKP